MILTNEELKEIYFGAYRFEETEDADGNYQLGYQYSKAQEDYFKNAFDFWYERCNATTSKTLEITTDATEISFDYKIFWMGSPDTFELWVDGLATTLYYVKDLKPEGRLSFSLPEGSKKVVIYLPADARVGIRKVEINGDFTPAKKDAKVLWLGDSITQGFGPLRSGQTYVTVANRILNYDIVNQGIGGYIYDKKSLMKMDGYTPDKIIVALGTNQYGAETMQDVEEYYERLMEIYGNDMPVLCISPLWRGDNEEGIPTLLKFCEKVIGVASGYSNVKVVDGLKLVPHLPEYYLDKLHPNCLGTEVYGRNLVEEIRKIGF